MPSIESREEVQARLARSVAQISEHDMLQEAQDEFRSAVLDRLETIENLLAVLVARVKR